MEDAGAAERMGPKAESVTAEGQPDGFEIPSGFCVQREGHGATRLLISVPTARLPEVHRALLGRVSPLWGVLYRQLVDRATPRPQGAPPQDFVVLEREPAEVFTAIEECASLIYHDARSELWIRGRRGEQVVLDADGLIYLYPDDLGFRDACAALGLEEQPMQTMQNRDYVKHWFHAENDAVEAGFLAGLGLSAVPGRGR
jgi:hypothetical protein